MTKSVLLVDDDASNRFTLSLLLEEEGLAVDVAASFAEASEKLAAPDVAYDIVLLDQNLGDGKGTKLVPTIRARLPHAKTVLISGSVDTNERAGVDLDGYVAKGQDYPEVLALITRLLGESPTAP